MGGIAERKPFLMETQRPNLLSLVGLLYRWRKILLNFTLGSGILAAFTTLLMPDYFRAEAEFLAVSPEQSLPENLFGGRERLRYFGGKEDLDRLLIIAESHYLKDRLIDSFDLFNRYRIHPDAQRARYRVRKKLSSLYAAEKTERDALAITIEDKDRLLAAQMVRYAGFLIDERGRALIRDGYFKMIQSLERGIAEKQSEIGQLSDSLGMLRGKYNLFNTKTQSEIISEQFDVVRGEYIRTSARLSNLKKSDLIPSDTIRYIEAEAEGLRAELDTLRHRVSMLNEGQLSLNQLEVRFYSLIEAISTEKERLKLLLSARDADIPALLEMEAAEVPLIKSRPKRTLIVLAVTFASFFLGLFSIVLLERYRQINWKEVLHEG